MFEDTSEGTEMSVRLAEKNLQQLAADAQKIYLTLNVEPSKINQVQH